MTRWLSFVGAPGTSVRCNCALAERQRIFDLEQRVVELEDQLETVTRHRDAVVVALGKVGVPRAAANEAEG